MKSVEAVEGQIPGASQKITAPVLVLVEGHDEAYFLPKMCEHWFKDRADQFDIENAGGGGNFASRFKAQSVRTPGPLKIVGVITDSEEDAKATSQRWEMLINEVQPGMKHLCKTLQLPSSTSPGAFETLVLHTLGDDLVVKCASTFRDCVAPHVGKRTRAQMDKIAVQAWLSARLGKSYRSLSGAQKDREAQPLLDYDHAAFIPIKTFLEGLLNLADSQVKPA